MLRFTALAATLLAGCRAAPLPDRSADADLRRHIQVQTDGGNVYVINPALPEPEAHPDVPAATVGATRTSTEAPAVTNIPETAESPPTGGLLELPLSSELPDAVFDQLEVLKIEGPHGKVNFKTTGYARYDSEESRCGSVVVVYTGVGHVQFDGAGMMITETVAGAFSSAGFTVSANRNRRGTEDALHAVVGVSVVMGVFRSLAGAVDVTEHSCGTEIPELKAPFDGDHTDVQVVEETLLRCGPDQAAEGVPPCPAFAALTTDSQGRTYFKRSTRMRSKKVEGVWRTIRSTTIPELNANPAVADEARGGRLVELTVGGNRKTYQFFPRSASAGQLGRCSSSESAVDYTDSMEANTADNEDRFLASFVGYDVLNGHYTKHFKVFVENGPKAGVDYYESYEESRPYSLGLFAPYVYTTYESVQTDQDVEPDFLQGPGYPSLDAADLETFLDSVTCTDHTELDKLGSADVEVDNATVARVHDQEFRAAELPDLQSYVSAPFVLEEFEEEVARGQADVEAMLQQAGDEAMADDEADELDADGAEDQDGRKRRVNIGGSCQSGPQGALTIAGSARFTMQAKTCSKGIEVRGDMTGRGRHLGIDLEGTGSMVLKAGRVGRVGTVTKGSFSGTASLTASLPGTGLKAKLTLAGKYTTNGARSHKATISGKVAVSLCGGNRLRDRREALAAFKEANFEAANRQRRFIPCPWCSGVSHGVNTVNTVMYYDEAIPGGIMPSCPKTQIGVGLALSYKDRSFPRLRNRIPYHPNGGKTITIFTTIAGYAQARIDIRLGARR